MWQKLPGPILLTCIALVGATTVWRTDWAKPLSEPFRDGETQHAVENAIDEGLTIREVSIQGWTAFRYAAFGEGMDGVVPGRDGWLFTKEEYEAGPDFEARRQAAVSKIVDSVRDLNAHGAQVIIALVPDKARIMADQLALPRPPKVEARYSKTRSELAASGIDTIDLTSVLAAGRKQSQVYLRTDTHWTPEGARIVAKALAPLLHASTSEHQSFDTIASSDTTWSGDLLSFLSVGDFAPVFGLNPEPVHIYRTSLASTTDGGEADVLSLFGNTTVPAALIGTSYSAIPTWNFVGFLQDASKTDILNRATEGEGPFAPMDAFLTDLSNGTPVPEAVVWEIPERYLTVDP